MCQPYFCLLKKILPDSNTDIYNVYVKRSVATFEIELVTLVEMTRRIEEISARYPYLVYEGNGKILGYSYAHQWKMRTAYSHTLETTIYVASASRGKGVGIQLMSHLIEACRRAGAHALIACITGGNEDSVSLHQRLGFQQVSHFCQVGNKFGQWLDL